MHKYKYTNSIGRGGNGGWEVTWPPWLSCVTWGRRGHPSSQGVPRTKKRPTRSKVPKIGKELDMIYDFVGTSGLVHVFLFHRGVITLNVLIYVNISVLKLTMTNKHRL